MDFLTGPLGAILIVAAVAVALVLEVVDARASAGVVEGSDAPHGGHRARRGLRLALIVLVVAALAETAVRFATLIK
jgi:hypothetical protein